MIEITARCQTCSAAWTPKKPNGPERDLNAAKRWAAAHGRRHPRHVVEASSRELVVTQHGSSVRMLDVEITRG